MADSRNEDLLENILGGSNEYGEPLSRNEAILQNILGEHNVIAEPTSRIEELLIQILEQGGSGGNIGYQVTFTVDGEPYYIVSCLEGESITEPPKPTVEGAFLSWQLNGVDITFPYTPNTNVELTANIATVHTEIEVTNAGEQLYSYSGGTITKANSGMAVFGYETYMTTSKFLFLVSKDADSTVMSGNMMTGGTKKSFTYNGETWYLTHSKATETTNIEHGAVNVGAYEDIQGGIFAVAALILDYYFGVA